MRMLKRCRYAVSALVLGIGLLFNSSGANAATIGFEPLSQSALVGDSVDVALTISGLGDFSADSLSVFDLDITFDDTILAFDSVVYGDPILGDQLDLFGFGSITATDDSVLGTVNLFELSFDLPSDLDSLQAGSFTLAVLSFDALAAGTSALDVSINALGDSFGAPLAAVVVAGSVVLVPEPGSVLLFLVGITLVGFSLREWSHPVSVDS